MKSTLLKIPLQRRVTVHTVQTHFSGNRSACTKRNHRGGEEEGDAEDTNDNDTGS